MKESELRNMLQDKDLPDSWWLTVDGKVESSPVSLGTAMTLKKAQSRSQIFVAHTSDNNPQPNWIELELTRETMPPIAKMAIPPALSEPMAQMDKGKIDRYRSSLNLPDQWWVSVGGEVQKDPVTEEIAKLLKTSNSSVKVLVANVQGDSANPFWIDFQLSDTTGPAASVLPAVGQVRTTVRPADGKSSPDPVAVAEIETPPPAAKKKPVLIAVTAVALLVIGGIVIFLATRPGENKDPVVEDKTAPKTGTSKSGVVPLVTPEMAYATNSAIVARAQLAKIRLLSGGPTLATTLGERFLAGPLFTGGPLALENISEFALSGQNLGQTWPEGPSSFCLALVPAKPLGFEELADAAKKAGASGSWTDLDSGGTLPLPASAAHLFPLASGQTLALGYAAAPITQVFVGTADAVKEALARCISKKAATPSFATGPIPSDALVFQAGLVPEGHKGPKAAEQAANFLSVVAQSTSTLADVEAYALDLSGDGKTTRLTLATGDDGKARTLEKAINDDLIGPSRSLARRTYLKIPGFISNATAASSGPRVVVTGTVSPEDAAILTSMAARGTPAPVTKNTVPVASGTNTAVTAKPTKPTPPTTPTKPSASAKTILSLGSAWKHFSSQSWPAEWNTAAFDDSSWPSGATPIGYGEVGAKSNPVTTAISGKPISVIARHRFTVADPAALKRITIRIQRDDGAVLYLNGREIHRTGMPSGRITFDTLANRQISDKNETDFETVALPVSLLKAGDNVIALSVHQDRAASSDLFFNLELLAE